MWEKLTHNREQEQTGIYLSKHTIKVAPSPSRKKSRSLEVDWVLPRQEGSTFNEGRVNGCWRKIKIPTILDLIDRKGGLV